MSITRESIIEVLYESINALNEQRSESQKLACTPETALGDNADFDSLAFVNFVAQVEDRFQDKYDKSLVLSGPQIASAARDPFETIGSLAEYIELDLAERHSS